MPDGIDHALREFARGGQRFRDAQVTRRFVKVDEVSEGAADIRGKPPHVRAPSFLAQFARRGFVQGSVGLYRDAVLGCEPGAP